MVGRGSNLLAMVLSPPKLVRGMSLRKVSYEAFVFSVFSRNQGKPKPLSWWSVSSEAL